MKRLAIANRGEIALRVARAARELGFTCGMLKAPDDEDGVAVLSVPPEDRLAVSSYLDVGDVVRACKEWQADFVHPGYGFLSENADFVAALDSAGIGFVGPTADQMRALGEKESAKKLADRVGVPTLQAVFSNELLACGSGSELEALLQQRGICAPWLVKASGGGGGRGMRVVQTVQDLLPAVRLASSEAAAGFGNAAVFVERYLEKGRHIEVQVFGDGVGGGVALGERECSLQRRHQKVIEEAPSPVVSAELREKLGKAALRLVQETRYRGAGTVEFLLTPESEFFFLEMNTRLQVEHPITEEVYGVDLVIAQLQLASGTWPKAVELREPQALPVLHPRGHAIEVRILAEDPLRGFVPTPGRILDHQPVKGENLRLESGIAPGARINPSYDSMIAKLIARGEDRPAAISRLKEGLSVLRVSGFATNVDFLRALLCLPEFVTGDFHTQWLELNLFRVHELSFASAIEDLFLGRAAGLNAQNLAFSVAKSCRRELLQNKSTVSVGVAGAARADQSSSGSFSSRDTDGDFVLAPRGGREANAVWVERGCVRDHGEPLCGASFCLKGPGVENWAQKLGSSSIGMRSDLHEALRRAAVGKGLDLSVTLTPKGSIVFHAHGVDFKVDLPSEEARFHGSSALVPELSAPMPGKILERRVQVGDIVEEGSIVIVMESMKMQLEIRAACAGVVKQCDVNVGQMVEAGSVLAIVEGTER